MRYCPEKLARMVELFIVLEEPFGSDKKYFGGLQIKILKDNQGSLYAAKFSHIGLFFEDSRLCFHCL